MHSFSSPFRSCTRIPLIVLYAHSILRWWVVAYPCKVHEHSCWKCMYFFFPIFSQIPSVVLCTWYSRSGGELLPSHVAVESVCIFYLFNSLLILSTETTLKRVSLFAIFCFVKINWLYFIFKRGIIVHLSWIRVILRSKYIKVYYILSLSLLLLLFYLNII